MHSSMYPSHQYCSTIRMGDVTPHLMCILCGGYFIDATTIIECLHSFCRTCIVRYLESSKFCPICEVQVHKTRPLQNIRSDKTLQDLVYKLVPGLFDEEMRRRREFLKEHPEVKTEGMDLEQRGHAQLVPVHSLPQQQISLVLQLASVGPCYSGFPNKKSSSATKLKTLDRRYLLCPSDVKVGHLKKFIRFKFGLPDKYHIDVFNPPSADVISDEFTLLDITFIYNWTREAPLHLCYSVYEKPRRKRRTAGTRMLSYQPSPTKVARQEQADLALPRSDQHSGRHPAPVPRPSLTVGSLNKPANGRPVSKKAQTSAARSFNCTKEKVKKIKKDFLKLHLSRKAKRKAAVEQTKNGGRGRKRTVNTQKGLTAQTHTVRHRGRPVGSKNGAKNGLVKSCARDSSLSGEKSAPKMVRQNSSDDNKKGTAASNAKRSKKMYSNGEKTVSPPATTSDVPKPCLKVDYLKESGSRSSSPKWSTPGSSRSGSPRPSSAGSKNSRCSSPKQKGRTIRKLSTGRELPKLTNGAPSLLPNGKEGLKMACNGDSGKASCCRDRPSSGGSSRTVSPRPADLQHVHTASTLFPSLPVQEKITVDVTMNASSSETSSDVTSPGAEDRANSTNLEEPGDFDSGSHACIVSAFAPRPLPSIGLLAAGTHRQCADKGEQASKDPAKLSRPSLVQNKVVSKTPNNKKR